MATEQKKFDAETADNLEEIEKQFAVKAIEHAQVYWNILEKMPGSQLKLTRLDDEIIEHLTEVFPDLVASNGATIDENEMKSHAGKNKWRPFLMKYEKLVDDYNFGTLLRTDAKAEYEEHTTIFVPRMQFFAIEILRNRAGLNDWICQKK
ncbi:hypothetical protein YB2330_004243 [Saitoella coloradoensis]